MKTPVSWRSALGLLFLGLVWGTQFLVIRRGQETVPPLMTACVRFAVLAALTQAAVLITRAWLPSKREGSVSFGLRLGFGLAQAIAMALLYVSERYVPSSVVAVVFGTAPFFVAVLAHGLVPGERLQGRILAATLLGFAGVALILLSQKTSYIPAIGVLAALAAAFAAALNKVLGKRLVHLLPTSVLLRDMAVVVAVGTGLGSWLFERHAPIHWTAQAVTAALYLGIVASAAASAVYLILLRRVPVTSMAYLQFVTALIGVLTGVLVGGESFQARHAMGASFVLAGLALLPNAKGRLQRAPSERSSS